MTINDRNAQVMIQRICHEKHLPTNKKYDMEKFTNIKMRLLLASIIISVFATAQETKKLAVDKPMESADFKTTEGAAIVNAKWFVQPAHIRETSFKSPGPSSKDP